jgi:lysophospholipase L1-like esterase
MRDASFRITLDVNDTSSQVSIPVKIGDTSRRIYISLTENGLPFPIEEGDFAVFTGVKSDSNRIADNCIIEDGRIRYDFTEQTVSAKGILECEVQVFGLDSEGYLYAPRFTIIVDDRLVDVPEMFSEEDNGILRDIVSSEATRKSAEAVRESNETTRQSNEEERKTNEFWREKHDEDRGEVFGGRVETWSGWEAAEEESSTAETMRCAAEALRIEAEEERIRAEEIRIEAEAVREEALADIDLTSLANFPRHNGFITTKGLWGSVVPTYQFIVVPVEPNENLVINKGANASLMIACLTEFPSVVDGEAVPFSSDANWNKRIDIKSETTYTMPSDARYLVVCIVYGGADCMPSVFNLGGYDYLTSARTNIKGVVESIGGFDAKIEGLEEKAIGSCDIFDGFSLKPKWESGAFSTTVGSTSNAQINVMRQRTDYIVFPGDITIINDGTYKLRLTLYDDDYKVVTAGGSYKSNGYVVPKNTIFRMCISNATNDSLDISALTSDDINAHFSFENKRLANIITPNVKWCAMGDSITEGHISYLDETTQTAAYKVSTSDAWAYKLAECKGWELTNKGIGGTGYIRGTSNRAWEVAATIDFNNFDLVTLAFGVNDWKNNCVLGSMDDSFDTPTTIYGGMRKTIETIIASNPLCKIYVITPINCSAKGDESTNWGLGSAYSNNGTLEDIFNAIKEVCEYYGIEMIDMTHSSIINRKNIKTCLLDNVHPTAYAHTVMARELGEKIGSQGTTYLGNIEARLKALEEDYAQAFALLGGAE